MNYLITGGCGFIGSNYINNIHKNKKITTIVNLDAMYYCANTYNISEEVRESKKYVFIKGDINDYTLVSEILRNIKYHI